tara:strand:- start:145 stop:342 length:198 start_codon:yes stop_codon:yes gene_type:complete
MTELTEKLNPNMTITLPQSEMRLVQSFIRRYRFSEGINETQEQALQNLVYAVMDEEKRLYSEVYK